MKPKVTSLAAYGALFALSFTGYRLYGAQAKPAPDAQGRWANWSAPRDSEQHFRELLNIMKAQSWSLDGIPLKAFKLKDVAKADDAAVRSGKNGCITDCLTRGFPETKEIAFYTDLYVHANRSKASGDRVLTHPTGYYLVAWKDGRVTKVPVEQVRTVRFAGTREFGVVFPGMAVYKENLPKHPWIEFADGYKASGSPAAQKLMDETTEEAVCQVPKKKP